MGGNLRTDPAQSGQLGTALRKKDVHTKVAMRLEAKAAASGTVGGKGGKGGKGGGDAGAGAEGGEDGETKVEEEEREMTDAEDDGTDPLFGDLFVAARKIGEDEDDEDEDENDGEGVDGRVGGAHGVPYDATAAATVWRGAADFWGIDGAVSLSVEEQAKVAQGEEVEHEDRLLLKGHQDKVMCCDASPDSTVLASGSADTQVILWDVLTGGAIRTFTGHEDTISCVVCISPTLVLTGSWDRTIRLWTSEKVHTLSPTSSHTLHTHHHNHTHYHSPYNTPPGGPRARDRTETWWEDV
jgi:hypothetical protein